MSPNAPVAFYAPMKEPDHPIPSGDRQIARLTLRALGLAGFVPRVVSRLRVLDKQGDPATQDQLRSLAKDEIERLSEALSLSPPKLWFTYHCHYKAPDLVGPMVARHLGIPYVISEPSISPRRRQGAWADFACASESAIAAADRLFWTTDRDRPALLDAGHGARMTHLPAFVDPGPEPSQSKALPEARLLTVAMMRPGDKAESYRRLAEGLGCLDGPWTLTVIGDGAARSAVSEDLRPFSDRVRFLGALDDPGEIRAQMETHEVFVWPGVNEGVGMVWLEAQAAGLPVVAEDHPAARALVANQLAPPEEPSEFAALIKETLSNRNLLSMTARKHVVRRHSIQAAAQILRRALEVLIK